MNQILNPLFVQSGPELIRGVQLPDGPVLVALVHLQKVEQGQSLSPAERLHELYVTQLGVVDFSVLRFVPHADVKATQDHIFKHLVRDDFATDGKL